jgi:hypothetical protein
MLNRRLLMQRWTARLAEAETHLARASPRAEWWYRMNVRLYRFLLACYGMDDWHPGDSTTDARTQEGTRSPSRTLVDNVGVCDGKPPRDVSQIRRVLDTVHAANESGVVAGPMNREAYQTAWVAATAWTACIAPRRCVRLLHKHGLEARYVRRGDDVIVEVRGRDLEEAVRLIDESRDYLRTRGQKLNANVPIAICFMGTLTFAATAWVLMDSGGMEPRVAVTIALILVFFAGVSFLVAWLRRLDE